MCVCVCSCTCISRLDVYCLLLCPRGLARNLLYTCTESVAENGEIAHASVGAVALAAVVPAVVAVVAVVVAVVVGGKEAAAAVVAVVGEVAVEA